MAKNFKVMSGSASNLEEIFDDIREMMEKDPMFGGKGKHAKEEETCECNCDCEKGKEEKDNNTQLTLTCTDHNVHIKCEVRDVAERTFIITTIMAHLLAMVPGNVKAKVINEMIDIEHDITDLTNCEEDEEN